MSNGSRFYSGDKTARAYKLHKQGIPADIIRERLGFISRNAVYAALARERANEETQKTEDCPCREY